MKKLIYGMVLLSGVLFSVVTSQAAMVTSGVWYDAQEMAVAIDLNHPEWDSFNRMELDFNTDREWGQIIDGSEWLDIGEQVVRRFEFGVYRNYQYPDGRQVRYFGWSHNPLQENENLFNWAVYIDQLYYGEKSPESMQCYSRKWAPSENEKTVFCQTIDAIGNATPILPEDISNIFIRHENADWTPLSSLQEPPTPVELSLRVNPSILEQGSRGQYLTARIRFPQDFELAGDHLNMTLQFVAQSSENNSPVEIQLQPVKWSALKKDTKKGVKHIIFKLPRKEFANLPLGEATLKLTGQFDTGEQIIAVGTLFIR